MHKIHMTLQGKGGVGKSLVTSMIAQYYLENAIPSINIDTDPVNASFSEYRVLNASKLKLLEIDQKLNSRRFDEMVEAILANEADYIIDNGASTFLPLANYMVENQVPKMINDAKRQLYIHCVITGGQALMDTISGLSNLIKQMPKEAKIIVWLNEFFGGIEIDGKKFEDLKIFTSNQSRIIGVITISKLSTDTFAKDFAMMLDRKLTFQEAIASSEFGLMAKQRLAMIRKSIFDQIAAII